MAWGNNSSGQTNVPPSLANVVQISAGTSHNLALKGDGKVVAWGSNLQGESHVPEGLSNVKAVVAGVQTSLALKRDGTVVAWGLASTNLPSGLSNVIALASGAKQNLALKADGTVAAWGVGYAGQTYIPPGVSNVIAIAAGSDQSLALKADGSVMAWGIGSLTNVPSSLSNVTGIAAGGSYNLSIVSAGPPQIVAEPSDVEVRYGSNLVLSVSATGFEPLIYRWNRNGVLLSDSSRVSGSRTESLVISNAQFSDAGLYSVVVSNELGAVRSVGANVKIYSPPVFLTQPASREVPAGSDVVLAPTVIGTEPISYRWRVNGSGIVGETRSTLTLTNVQLTNSGAYSLLAGNIFGTNESSNAVLSVIASAPSVRTQPANQSAHLGGVASFSVSARGSDPLYFQWQREGKNIPGATNATLNLSGLRFEDEGFYSVVVSNSIGVIVSAKALLTVSQLAVWGTQVPSALTNFPAGLSNVVALAAGESHVLALKKDGTVAAWGSRKVSVVNQIITFVETNTPATNIPPDLEGVVAISAGQFHNLALKSDGTVVAWGDNVFGQTNVPPNLSNVVAIAAGGNNSMALRADDSIVVWGNDLIRPPKIDFVPLTNVPPGLSNVTAIAAGLSHGMALKNDGRVTVWGNGTNAPAGVSNVIAIAFSKGGLDIGAPKSPWILGTPDDFLALRSDGTVVSWSDRYVPLPNGFAPVLGLSNVVAISGGYSSLGALRSDGSVYVSQATNRPPQSLTNVVAIAAGGSASVYNSLYPEFFVAAVGNGSPAFTIQPATQRAVRGEQIQLHARAVGVQQLRFQWQLNGTNIPGATNGTFTISNFQPGNIGEYRAIASNALGVSTSKVAIVSLPVPSLPHALNADSLSWSNGGSGANENWFAQLIETHDGEAAAQSGSISHNEISRLQTTVIGPGTIRFWWKTSSEFGYDFLKFFIGETNAASASLSGETDWQRREFSVPAGTNILRWIYTKDSSVSAGSDAGWLDEVSFTPAAAPAELQFFAPQILDDGSLLLPVSRANRSAVSLNDLEGVELQTSSNLVEWFPLTNGECTTTLSNGVFLIQDASKTNWPTRFYRVIHR